MITLLLGETTLRLPRRRANIESLLRQLHLNPETTLVVHNKTLLTEDQDLVTGETYHIVRTTADR
jgi:sulfur carrier protein ThiS